MNSDVVACNEDATDTKKKIFAHLLAEKGSDAHERLHQKHLLDFIECLTTRPQEVTESQQIIEQLNSGSKRSRAATIKQSGVSKRFQKPPKKDNYMHSSRSGTEETEEADVPAELAEKTQYNIAVH